MRWTRLTARGQCGHVGVENTWKCAGAESVASRAGLFHKFIRTALDYYKTKRLADAIQQTTTGGASADTEPVRFTRTVRLLGGIWTSKCWMSTT